MSTSFLPISNRLPDISWAFVFVSYASCIVLMRRNSGLSTLEGSHTGNWQLTPSMGVPGMFQPLLLGIRDSRTGSTKEEWKCIPCLPLSPLPPVPVNPVFLVCSLRVSPGETVDLPRGMLGNLDSLDRQPLREGLKRGSGQCFWSLEVVYKPIHTTDVFLNRLRSASEHR